MKKILQRASSILDSHEDHIRKYLNSDDGNISFYSKSVNKVEKTVVAMARDHKEKFLLILSGDKNGLISKFDGEQIGDHGIFAKKCFLKDSNAALLRSIFPWTAPVSLKGRKTTIGCGDRLGLASPGHVAAIREFEASPVLAQQSMRELSLTGRTYRNVADDTTFLVFQSGFKDGYGADGDHLKKIPDIDTALDAGMPMITLDLSEVMNAEAGKWTDGEIEAAFGKLPSDTRDKISRKYFGKLFHNGGLSLKISEETAKRCAVMYLAAIDFAVKVHEHLKKRRGDDFDLEISIDETSSPTLPEHHIFIANELLGRGVSFASLAPRFIGEFQKAVDYIGDKKEFARQFAQHAEIAATYGCYKLSIHSGSDKFAVFPVIGKQTDCRLHLKTAGTSWLEAAAVIAEKDPTLYRVMHSCAVKNVSEALKLYHITADFNKIPALENLSDAELPKLMQMDEARQLIHITYGAILNDPVIRPLFFADMHKHEEFYHERLKLHFEKHLTTLGAPPRHK